MNISEIWVYNILVMNAFCLAIFLPECRSQTKICRTLHWFMFSLKNPEPGMSSSAHLQPHLCLFACLYSVHPASLSFPLCAFYFWKTVMGSEAAKWDKISISELCVYVATVSYITCNRKAGQHITVRTQLVTQGGIQVEQRHFCFLLRKGITQSYFRVFLCEIMVWLFF